MKRRLQLITASVVTLTCLSQVISAQEQIQHAGNAAKPVDTNDKSKEATAYIYRPKKWKGTTKEPSVFVDGIEVARMDNGRYFIVKLKPGPHVIHLTDKNKSFSANMRAGEIYYFLITMERGGGRVSYGVLTLSDAATGLAEIRKLKYLGRSKIRDHTIVVAPK